MLLNKVSFKLFFFTALTAILIIFFEFSAFANESYVTNARVNFRAEASTNAQIYKTLNTGTEVTVTEYNTDWSKASIDGISGYIKSEFILKKADYNAKKGNLELLSWHEVKNIFTTYTPAEVLDVRTGITYYVQSFSNGKHADVETLTKDDTNKLLQTYGGKWQWDPRPVWVTINGRTIAGSINGMPHGGGTIAGNGMNGQVCIHFLDSSTHNGNLKFAQDHQTAVYEAFEAK